MKEPWKFRSIFLSVLSLRALLSADGGGLESIPDREGDDALSTKETASAEIGWSLFSSSESDQGYTINFNNVSIKEYIHFISKISGVDFIYDEGDLGFNVSIVSQEPMSLKNIMSALVQTLRIHGLNLLESDNSLMITRSTAVGQVATLDLQGKGVKGKNPAIVTRLFKIKNSNLVTIATIIKPMTSAAALVEVIPETRQFIITDTVSNIEKIDELIKGLDAATSPLEIENYKAAHMPPAMLIDLTKQIVAPFAGGSPLIFVPLVDQGTIFVVSTPALVERVMEIMEDLDVRPKSVSTAQLTRDQIFLYKLENKGHKELLDALHQIQKELKETGAQSVRLIDAIDNVKWVQSTNSLLFITDTETQTKLQDILKTLDTTTVGRNFYVYKVDKAGKEQIENSLSELAKMLKKNPSDQDLVGSIQAMRYIKETNSFVFTGSDETLKTLKDLLPTFDTALSQYSPSSHFMLYNPVYLNGHELEKSLEEIEDKLDSAGLSDQALLNAIASIKWVPSTNALLFTGDPASLAQITSIIKLIDVPSGASSKIFIYQPKSLSYEQVEEALDELADKLDTKNLTDRNLASAIDHMTWIAESQSFLFKANPGTIEKIQGFLADLDNPQEAQANTPAYFLYNLKYARGEDVISHLEAIAKNLPSKDPAQKAIAQVIDEISLLKQTNSLLITGTHKAVEEVKTLISQFDQPGATPVSLEKTSFFIYKPLHVSPDVLKSTLEETAIDLKAAGLVDPLLLDTIQSMRVVDATGTVVFTGSTDSLQKTKEILTLVDVEGAHPTGGQGQVAGQTFFIYRARFLPLSQLLSLLTNLVTDLEKKQPDRALIEAVKGAKEVPETNSLLFTGTSPALQKISELLTQLDTATGPGYSGMSNYLIYKPLNVSGPQLIEMMREFKLNLISTGVRDQGLFTVIDNLKYIEKTGFILVSGDQASIDKALELLRKFDMPGMGAGVTTLTHLETSFLVYKLQYHAGSELQPTLRQIATDLLTGDPTISRNLINAINSVQWIKMTNSLLATGTPEVLTRIRELIQSVDVPLRQVFIEMLIIETTIANNQQFGLQWGGKAQYLNRFAAGTGNFPSPNTLGGFPANQTLVPGLNAVNATTTPTASMIPVPNSGTGGWDLGAIGDIILHKGKTFFSLAALVNALQQDNDSVVVMNPKIIAQDGMQSTIFVGQNIPFTGSIVTTNAVNLSQQQSANIEYRDVGVNLTITPLLGTDEIVTMDISNDITKQVNSSTAGNIPGLTGLQTTHTNIMARVHVPNNHFVALSGFLNDTKTHFKSSIPCLGSIPVIGAIFSENDRNDAKDNLIFFIRPSIIDSIEQFKKITETQECLYKEQAIKQVLKEEIDSGIDWVKTPDDE